MTTLASLKRPAKWRENVRKELEDTVNAGIPIYGVRRDGKYVEKTLAGEKVLRGHRSQEAESTRRQ